MIGKYIPHIGDLVCWRSKYFGIVIQIYGQIFKVDWQDNSVYYARFDLNNIPDELLLSGRVRKNNETIK